MNDADKTREQLDQELAEIRQQLAAKEAETLQVKQALRRGEITIRALLDAPQQSVFVLDTNSTILEINEIAARRCGKRADDLIGTNVFDLMPSELARSREAHYRRVIETGKLVQFEDCRAGTWFENQIFPIVDDEDTVTRLVIFAHDISERKQAEQALRESEARYKELFEHVPVALLEEDFSAVKAHIDRLRADGVTDFRAYFEENVEVVKHCASLVKIVGVNQATLDVQQVEQPQDAESDFSTTFEEDTYAIFRDELIALASGASHFTGESSIKTFTGQERAIRLVLRLDPGYQDDWSRVYVVVTDITEGKQAEQQRLELALERERVQILGNFVTQASHEFRTPLTIINTSAHLAQRLNDPAERQRQVTRISEQVNHITKLVEDLITLAGLDSTRTLETTEIDPRSVIHTVHDLMQPGHHDKNLNVVVELSPDVPQIQGHFDYLRQAVERIWSNAVRHTPDGGTITVRMDRLDHDSIQIDIADTGCGIHPEDLPRVFERFFRTDRAGTTRGFGLGLPIAKAVVELHRGTIEVQSDLDQGTTFCITLPAG